MSALLHPVGPESEETYWKRRAVALVALVVGLAVFVWLVQTAFTGPNGSTSIGATPSGDSTTPTTSASTTPTGTPTGTPSTDGTPGSPSANSSTPSSSPSSPAASTTASTPAVSPTPTPTKSATPKPTGPVICTPESLRVIPTGARQVVSGKTTTFRVHLVNQTAQTCIVDFTTTPLKFWINSGNDRIHTTDHCANWPPKGRVTLKPTQRFIWAHTWTTKRSTPGCRARPDYLRPGTYVANATLGAGQVNQWVLRLVL